MKTIKFRLEIERKELSFVDNIIKAYEGLAFATVEGIEGETGILNVETTEAMKDDLLRILQDLQKKLKLEIVKI